MTWPVNPPYEDVYIPNLEYICDFNLELDELSMEKKLKDLIQEQFINHKYKILKVVVTAEVKFDDQSKER